jgi:hypothetical protein
MYPESKPLGIQLSVKSRIENAEAAKPKDLLQRVCRQRRTRSSRKPSFLEELDRDLKGQAGMLRPK